MMLHLLLATSAQLLSAQAAATFTSVHNWRNYANVRYGFQVCYPAETLKPQGETDNSDGQTFIGLDGAELRVFGANNVFTYSLPKQASEQARYYMGKRGRITYHATKPGWEVVSGDDGGLTIFYTKTFQRDDQFVMLQLKYPKRAQAQYKAVVEHLSRCFKLTDGHL